MSNTDERDYIYRVIFTQNDKVYDVYSRGLTEESLMGFVEVEELIFDEKAGVVVDPSEEKLKNEFEGVIRSYIPMHNILRIDEVTKKGIAKIVDNKTAGNISHFPGLKHPGQKREDT